MQLHSVFKKLALVAIAGLLPLKSAMAVEEPAFRVLKTAGDVELREYSPYMVAEVRIEAGFTEAGNRAFSPLFGYISGKNRGERRIDMTAPVTQRADAGTRIDMTAPVTQRPDSATGAHIIGFVLPAQFNRENSPEPTDARVKLREVPGALRAAIRYSGSWNEARYREHEQKLMAQVDALGYRTLNAPVFARYNDPFTLWFLRRNEIIVDVVAATSSTPSAPATPATPAAPSAPAAPGASTQ
jgi:SOUL heme-binding protein